MIPFPHTNKSLLAKVPMVPGRFAEAPAGWIDLLYLEEPTTLLGKIFIEMERRFIFVTLMPITLIVDTLYNLSAFLVRATQALWLTDKEQTVAIKALQEHAFNFSKSVFAICGLVFGLIEPRWVSYFFNPDRNKTNIAHSGGNINYQKVDKRFPKSTEEIQAIIKEAISDNKKVCVKGAGFSQGEQYLNGNHQDVILIDLGHFNTFSINDEDKTVTAGAGCLWGDIQNQLNERKLALKVMQASNIFSVAGSLSTNIHGWDYHSGMLSETVLSIEIINGEGEKVTLTHDDEQFHAICGGFGLCGIITKVTFSVKDNIKLQSKADIVKPEDFITVFNEKIKDKDSIDMFRYRLSISPDGLLKEGLISFYEKTKDNDALVTPDFCQEGPIGKRADRIFANAGKNWNWVRRRYWQNEMETLPQTKELTSTNAVMQPEMNAMFNHSVSESEWLQEYFLPEAGLTSFIDALSKILTDNNVSLINCSVRYVKANPKGLLSYAPEDRFAVVICFNQSLKKSEIAKASKWINEAAKIATEKGGTYYLPYQQVASTELFNEAYGTQAEIFKAKKNEYDPHEIFYTGFYEKYIKQEKTVKRLNYQALLEDDNWPLFENFVSSVLKRLDTKKFKAVLEEVCSQCNSDDEIYLELKRRLPEIQDGIFTDLKNGLNALSAINKELTEQTKKLLGNKDKIDGYLEIGYPGRYIKSFKKAFHSLGKTYAMHPKESMMDYVEAGFPRPYDEFLPLVDLNPEEALKQMPDNSVEVISCFYGLHHFPEDKLDAFLKELRRVLKPGGHLLLNDHDVIDEKSHLLAHAAHTMVNLIGNEPLDVEQNELRLFKPMAQWQQKLKAADFDCDDSADLLIREGDSSRNAMVVFKNDKENRLLASQEKQNPYKFHLSNVSNSGVESKPTMPLQLPKTTP